jgi:MOSC domain-containing protein YiiM
VRSTEAVIAAAETCEACAFDGAEYDVPDSLGTLRAIGPMWRQSVDGVPAQALLARPAPDVWSAAEHAAHSADVIEAMGRLLHGLLTMDGLAVEAVPEVHAPDVSDGFAAALARLEANLTRLYKRARHVGTDRHPAWARTASVDGRSVDGAWVLRHAIHDTTHHLSDAGRGLVALGVGAPTQTGTVAQLNRSDGGVPKLPVDAVEVGHRGVVGDRQAARQHHGRPFQALCLWSAEVIEALQAEGHPIGPGRAGENVTIQGIDWKTIRSGVRLRIGDVLAEISAWSTPCWKNAQWFVEGDIDRMDHSHHPGWSRAYAWVRQPGTIRTGDPVVVEPS